jgi:hypothetical protein
VPWRAAGYAHCGTEVVIDTRGNCVLMPSVVERAFRPRRNALVDHYLDAYTTAFDALVARHAHIDSRGDEGKPDDRTAQLPGLHVEPEDGEGQEQTGCYEPNGTFSCTRSFIGAGRFGKRTGMQYHWLTD